MKKKFIQTGKKSMSLMLAMLMVFTCLVFAPTVKADAVDGGYALKVVIHESNSFDSSENSSYLRSWDKDGNLIYEKYLGDDPWGSLGSKSEEHTYEATVAEYPARVQVSSYKNSGVSWGIATDGRIRFTAYVNGIEIGMKNSGLKSGHVWIVADLMTPGSMLPVDLSDIDFDKDVEQSAQEELKQKIKNALSQIKFSNDTIKGPYIDLFGKKIYLFEIVSSFSFNLDIFKVTLQLNYPEKTVQVLIGYDDGYTESGNPDEWTDTYKEVKDLYAKTTEEEPDTTGILNAFSSLKDKFQNIEGSYLFNANFEIIGFMEFSFENKDFQLSEGGIITNAAIGVDVTTPFPNVPVFYSTFAIDANASGAIKVKNETELSFLLDTATDLRTDLGIGVGAKVANLYIEGGLTGNLDVDFNISTGDYYVEKPSSLYVGLTGGLFVQGSLLGFISKRYQKDFFELQLYPELQAEILMARAMMMPNSDVGDYYSEFTPADRDYLNMPMARMFAAPAANTQDDVTFYSDKNVYDYNAPVLTKLADGTQLMLWVDDDGTKNDINKTSLMYSIYNGTSWTAAQALFEDGTFNGAPQVSVSGDRVDIIWSKAKTVFADDAQLADLVTDTEIFYTSYEDGTFSDAIQITTNDMSEFNYQIASNGDEIAIIWTENSENDLIGQSGTYTIYKQEFTNGAWVDTEEEPATPVEVVELDSAISEAIVYANGNDFDVAYGIADADLVNELIIDSSNTTIDNASNVTYEDGYLYYIRDGKIYKRNVATDADVELGLGIVDNFEIYNGDIYTLSFKDYVTELYASELVDGAYTPFKQMTKFDKYIREYSVSEFDNEPIFALNLVNITENEDGIAEYANSELVVSKEMPIDDLVLSALYYADDQILPNGEVEIKLDVANTGNTDVETIDVVFKDENSNEVYTTSVAADLAAGESKTVSFNYTLPDAIEFTEYSVEAFSSTLDITPDNNTNKFAFGYANGELTNLKLTKVKNGEAYITGTVTNKGYTDMTNCIVDVSPTLDLATSVATIEIGALNVGDSQDFKFDVPEAYLTIEDNTNSHSLSFELISDQKENVYSNNEMKVTFGELTHFTLFLVKDGTVIDQIDSNEFDTYDPTIEGYTFHGWYSNDYFLDPDLLVTSIPNDISEDQYLFGNYIKDAEYINITADKEEMQKGTAQTLKADQMVTWSVSGGNSAETTINATTGELAIGADETAASVTVTAVKTTDANVTNTIVIKVHEHTFGAWTVLTPATCTTPGVQEHACTTCQLTETDEIAIKPHNYDTEYTVDKAPTCTSTGIESRHCKDCDATTDSREIEMLDHDFGDWVTDVEPTCHSLGSATRTCKDCQATETCDVAMLEHNFDDAFTIDKEPTCTEQGSKSRHCADCDAKAEVTVIQVINHVDEDGDGKCDMCEKVLDPTVGCDCLCHKDDSLSKFFYEILCFFWKLFGINDYCDCGIKHY